MNVNVAGNTVQVPVAAAIQVCDLDANVLATQFVGTEDVACEIDQATAAEHNIGGGGQGEGQGRANAPGQNR